MAICQTITTVMDSYFFDQKTRKNLIKLPTDEEKKNSIAMIFYYATMWAFGAITNTPEGIKNFETKFKERKIAELKDGNPLDWYYDINEMQWIHWSQKVPTSWENVGNLNYFEIIIPNLEIYKLRYFMELHYLSQRSVCLAGGVGTGKTTFVR